MSDIDFDELDKAVNSLVTDKSDTPVAAEKPTQDAPELEETEKSSGDAPIPSHRSGRFMDMVHSSSDMKKDSGGMMTTSTTNITPINDDVKPDSIGKDTHETVENPNNQWSNTAELSETKDGSNKEQENKSNTDMPDPLDHQPADKQDDQDDKNDKPDEKAGKNDDNPSVGKDEPKLDYEETTPPSSEKKDDTKKTSPFIDDAKVDKRPLGGSSSIAPEPKPEAKPPDEKTKSSSEEPPIPPPAEPVELPPELDKNLVAIEAGEAPEISKVPEDTPDTPEADKDTTDKSSENGTEASEKKSPSNNQKERVEKLLANAKTGSIPDQYKRENRSHELHAPHPLFDAEHYENNPATAAKKPKSAPAKFSQWIFIILGLLLLGGSIGAAIFVFINHS